jgi:enterochelin esterase-like enzyme
LLAHRPAVARNKLIWLDVGRDDLWLANVEALHAQLDALDVPHQFRLFGGEHNGVYWTEHLPDYLRFYSTAFDRIESPDRIGP